ncbi:MAG: rhomboid family intramembrane serine protease [Myxococcales bacterium]|nr:rhomboid family intramembrane serine protease [Myxococcales bacterium]
MTDDVPTPSGAHPRATTSRPSVRARILAVPVTVGIIVLCIGAFVSTLGACTMQVDDPRSMLAGSWLVLEGCDDTLAGLGALRMADLWLDGSWWRVISAGLLHGSWLHLILNTWSLWVVGEWVEPTWGHARTAVLFALSSVCGCLASAAWVEASMVVGASAGIMGMAGALLVGRVLGRGAVAKRLRPVSAWILGGWLVVLVGVGAVVPVVAQAGHLGGLATGALLGVSWSGREAIVGVAGRVGLMIVFAALVLMARQPEGRPAYYEHLGHGYLSRGQDLEAVAAFERALEQRPDEVSLANGVAYGLAKAGVQLERAEELVERALAEEPENADYLDTLGWIYCRRGEVERGMAVLERASVASEGAVEEIEQHRVECAGAGIE